MEPRRLELHGLKSEVLVNFDIHGIPHINAENISDLNFVHGYVKAGERLWQMDYLRRAAAGRLAEILGAGVLDRYVE